jgi:hypothetical protein
MTWPENLQEAENGSKNVKINMDLTTHIQNSFKNQHQVCPYKQYTAPINTLLMNLISGTIQRTKKFSQQDFRPDGTTLITKPKKKNFSNNIQISLRNKHAINPHKQEKGQLEHKVNLLGLLNHSVDILFSSDEPTSGQSVTQYDTKTRDIVISIQHILDNQHPVYSINEANFPNLLSDSQMFNEKLTTDQNKTDNTNKTNDVVTNTQSPLEDQESTYCYDQLEGQPEDRLLHNLASTQFVPEKQTIVQNITQADIKPKVVLTSTSNVFVNQYSLYPNNQHEEQITQEYNEVRFLKLSNISQVLTETSASRIYITGNINKTRNVVNSFQISLNDRQTKYSDEELRGSRKMGSVKLKNYIIQTARS